MLYNIVKNVTSFPNCGGGGDKVALWLGFALQKVNDRKASHKQILNRLHIRNFSRSDIPVLK
jgi:hypothetical protein